MELVSCAVGADFFMPVVRLANGEEFACMGCCAWGAACCCCNCEPPWKLRLPKALLKSVSADTDVDVVGDCSGDGSDPDGA